MPLCFTFVLPVLLTFIYLYRCAHFMLWFTPVHPHQVLVVAHAWWLQLLNTTVMAGRAVHNTLRLKQTCQHWKLVSIRVSDWTFCPRKRFYASLRNVLVVYLFSFLMHLNLLIITLILNPSLYHNTCLWPIPKVAGLSN